MRKTAILLALLLLGAGVYVLAGGLELNSMEQLGKSIYFDDNLSINRNQACAACHAPDVGFTGPIEAINLSGAVYEGSIPGRFGNRKPPSAAYATTSPLFDFVEEKKDALFVGGNFWDGRATGYQLGNPAADQAVGPFLNPAEQALPDAACVVHRVCIPTIPADYPVSFEAVWGMGTCDIAWPADVEAQCASEGGYVMLSDEDRAQVMENYGNIGRTIAAFEGSYEVNAYTSKYDYYLAGMVKLTHEEKVGLNMFKSKGKCANCHVLDEGPDGPPLFTDYTFDNLGTPINADNPAYISTGFIDPGLGGFLQTLGGLWGEMADENMGKQKVPTLRNVAKVPYEGFVKSYTHNGYFKTLEGLVHFYNTRDIKNVCPDPLTPEAMAIAMNCWPAPEVAENVNHDELGDLKLTDDQEKAIVAFMKTLSDGYMP